MTLKIGCMGKIVRKWVHRSKRKELDDVSGPNRTGVSRTSKEFYVEDVTSSVYVEIVHLQSRTKERKMRTRRC
jgi:hypothetical protein